MIDMSTDNWTTAILGGRIVWHSTLKRDVDRHISVDMSAEGQSSAFNKI